MNTINKRRVHFIRIEKRGLLFNYYVDNKDEYA